MERDYADHYQQLYQQHWWWRSREAFVFRILQQLTLAPQPNILDIGCGNGYFFAKLLTLGGKVTGIEFDRHLVSDTMRQAHAIHIGPFDRTYRTDERYDLILMLDVLEHIESDLDTLLYAKELLKPEGKLVITVPAFAALWTHHDELNHHYRRYTRRGIREVANLAGLRVHSSRYFFHSLVPLKLLVRMKESLFRSKGDLPTVPISWINRAAQRFFRSEQYLGAPMPWLPGSSLVIVAERQSQATNAGPLRK
jgi:protein-L-isoaspartate O-methyltransferase